MTETSYFWEGTAVGDATLAPYTNDELSDIFRDLVQLNKYAAVLTVASKFEEEDKARGGRDIPTDKPSLDIQLTEGAIVVHPGAAIIDGKVYCLREPVTFYCNDAGYYRVVLRKEFPGLDESGKPKGQTVKLVMLYSKTANSTSVAANSAPLPTRVDSETWDVSLALVEATIDTNIYGRSVVLLDYYYDEVFYSPVEGIADSLGYRESGKSLYPFSACSLPKRRGGSATAWATGGTTNYVVPMARVEAGAVAVAANPQSHTFNKAFSNTPIVIVMPHRVGTPWSGNNLCISAISTTGFSVRFDSIVNLDAIQFIAFGPP